jgi:lipoprotein-anchoring transpeptidase ErfK/SrfK
MSNSSLPHKTVRPGSLNGYSYYYSNRQTPIPPKSAAKATAKASRPGILGRHKGLVVILLVIIAGFMGYRSNITTPSGSSDKNVPVINSDSQAAAGAPVVNNCAGNNLDKFIKISIKQRHLWACEGSKTVQNSTVITGLQHHPETETPLGTYKIYGKLTNTTLTGSDSRGSWSDPVYYWMPFLDNQYGTYGFHDATWRPADAFGKVSPDSQDASHGCVELPLAASKALYEWAPVGTTVTVES